MKRKVIALFVLLSLSICYSRNMQIPIHFENSPTTIELYNIKGQRVFSQEFSRYTGVPFSISNNLANQVYIMRIRNGANVSTRKFTPNHRIQFTGSFNNIRIRQANSISSELQQQKNVRSTEAEKTGIDSMTNIFFINGIWNTESNAERNLERVEAAYIGALSSEKFPGEYKFSLVYNETHGFWEDLFEVENLLKREIAALRIYYESDEVEKVELPVHLLAIAEPEDFIEVFRDNLNDRIETAKGTDNEKTVIDDVALMIQQVEEFLKDINDRMKRLAEILARPISYLMGKLTSFFTPAPTQRSLRAANNIDDNIVKILASLKETVYGSLNNKERVIVIPHSQGNLYANLLIDDISPEFLPHIAVLNIAPPSTRTSMYDSAGWYFTNHDDWVIDIARWKYDNVDILPGMFNDFFSTGEVPSDWKRHSFWESYFHPGWVSRTEIDKEIFKQCTALSFWKDEEEDSTEYYVTVDFTSPVGTMTTIEILKNNGEYVLVGNYFHGAYENWSGGSLAYTIKLSNLALKNENLIRVSFDCGWLSNEWFRDNCYNNTYDGFFHGNCMLYAFLSPFEYSTTNFRSLSAASIFIYSIDPNDICRPWQHQF